MLKKNQNTSKIFIDFDKVVLNGGFYGTKGSRLGQCIKRTGACEMVSRWRTLCTDLTLMPRDYKMAGENLHPRVVY